MRGISHIVFFCYIFFATFFTTQKTFANNLETKNHQDLQRIETYLNSIKNLSSNFIQRSDGVTSKGKFYLSRPGKMRVEYDDQPQILITVNGAILTYKDLELDEISNLSTNTTPASFLTRKNISFSAKDVKLVDFKKDQDSISVAVIKKNRPEAGEFRLIFKNEPLSFVKMQVKNELGQITTIELKNISYPEKLRNKLFVIRNKNLPL